MVWQSPDNKTFVTGVPNEFMNFFFKKQSKRGAMLNSNLEAVNCAWFESQLRHLPAV